ncbi:MAG: TIGR00730 family Rossman fold protein [Bacteroidales bacterium]|jgi:uncharacterized protein (TIGR00730 family)|nr:TIGR00730 family Rossman fold protein [Bacteroidales bacterium]
MKTITVYCASSSQIAPIYTASAQQLGRLMAVKNIVCINGAGNRGLMATLSNAILESGGKVTGIIPRFMVEEGWSHPDLTEIIVTNNMHIRKQLMAEKSDACIALPGGTGTLEELLEIITWKQLGLYSQPIVILNIHHYYDDLLRMFEKAIRENFMHPQHQHIYQVAFSPEEALSMIEEAKTWHKNPRSIAAL